MTRAEFEKLVAEGYERLPQWVREKIKNVALLVEDEPSQEDREAEGLGEDETLLGLYKGVPLSARGQEYGVGATLPDTITLYRLPIEDAAEDELSTYEVDRTPNIDLVGRYKDRVQKIVTETIWHEFAHHFGMDEGEVRDREQKRDQK
ncbi:MAG: metallopeptidase family protein [Patescibacteria group bacterium]